MCITGLSLSLLIFSLLSCGLRPLLAFSLKNCTIAYSENPDYVCVSCSSHELTAVPDDIPKNTTFLDLSLNHILNISSTDFQGLSKMTNLQVVNNGVSHIADRAFADLTEMMLLSLDMNKLIGLTDHMFEGLSKLKGLILSENRISYISPKAFQSLVSLEMVNLDSNKLQQVSFIAPLLQLPAIANVGLGSNKFTSFDSSDFDFNVTNVSVLEIDFNPLRKFSITKDFFPNLQSLDISKCTRDIEWDVPNKSYLRSLTVLSFSGEDISYEVYREILQTANALQRLSLLFMEWNIQTGLMDVACRVPSLRILEATQNKIGILNDDLLRSCSQLSELNLSCNRLSELSENSLRSLAQLRILTLSSNHLYRIPLALKRLSALEVLDMQSNLIGELDCLDFQNLTRLTNLNLNSNRISNLKGCVFQSLANLTVLNIGDNAVFSLGDSFRVHLQKLESLNLHNNALNTLHQGDFRNLSSLRVLDLESDTYYIVEKGVFDGLDNVQTLRVTLDHFFIPYKKVFAELQHLEYLSLHLTWNWRRSRPKDGIKPHSLNLPNLKQLFIKVYDHFRFDIKADFFECLKSLEYLMTEKFFNTSLHPDTFIYTPRLRGLQIIHSNLTHLEPKLFWPTPNLQALDLSNNVFRSLEFLTQANLSQLKWLKLCGNKLSVLSETVFQSLPALLYLDLTDNPLTCECSNLGFNLWVLTNIQTQVVNGHQYTCAFPVSQQGNKFLDFDTQSCWLDASFVCFVSSTCLIVLTLLSSFIYHFLRLHLIYAYYLFRGFLYDKRRGKERVPYRYDAFVSYNVHNEDWVYRELLPQLEGQQGWRLCLHHRDFEPGKPIIENITDAIYGSRKTICVISRHYLQSEWCSREIQMASFRLFDEQKDVLILLFLEDIPTQQLSPYYRMRSLVKRCTYLSWPQAGGHAGFFWLNVGRALGTAEAPPEHTHTRLLENEA